MAKRKCTLSLISDLTSPINISLLKLITISFLSEWILYHELVRKLLHKTSSNLNALCECIRMAMLYFIEGNIEILLFSSQNTSYNYNAFRIDVHLKNHRVLKYDLN